MTSLIRKRLVLAQALALALMLGSVQYLSGQVAPKPVLAIGGPGGGSGGGGAPSGSAGGDLSGTYPNPVVAKIQEIPVHTTDPAGLGDFLGYDLPNSRYTPFTFGPLLCVSGNSVNICTESVPQYSSGTSVPGSCAQVGLVFFKTDAAAGQGLYYCNGSEYEAVAGAGGGSLSPPHIETVTAQTSVTVTAATHGHGANPSVRCYDNATPRRAVSCDYTVNGDGDVVLTFSPAHTGTVEIGGPGGGVFSEIASQAEAEAGTNNTKGMTPLRVAEAIAELASGGTQSLLINAQTGTTDTVATDDRAKLITYSNAASIAVTLPQAGVSFPDGWYVFMKNIGAGDATITPATSTISGAASIVLSTGEWALIQSNGTNYEAITNRMVAGSGIALAKARTGLTVATTGQLTCSRTTLSSADILALNATAITLIAAQGANTVVTPVHFRFRLIFNTTQYANGGNLLLRYVDTAGEVITLSPAVSASFINSPATGYHTTTATGHTTAAAASVVNQPVTLSTSTAFITGNSTMTVDSCYTVQDYN